MNCVAGLKLLRLIPRTLSSSTDFMWGDITSVDDGMEIEMCFLTNNQGALRRALAGYKVPVFAAAAEAANNFRSAATSELRCHWSTELHAVHAEPDFFGFGKVSSEGIAALSPRLVNWKPRSRHAIARLLPAHARSRAHTGNNTWEDKRSFHFLCYPTNGPRPALQSEGGMDGDTEGNKRGGKEQNHKTREDETVGK
ncbi:hypothetical protein EYF80_005119 [Liparis tanakae]|uniref:Uncharacterized protein n=1 Tax=Liparis tanakae TaxID=230148 RepID=A0A4Z2J486_9TELE|nr:hypothetical protein EYF80_005119 [Liparis tanakae]